MSATYQLLDEPRGTKGGLPVVDPFWPLLGLMFGGAWLGAALFVCNAIALRGPTWVREVVLAVAMLLVAPLILLMLGMAVELSALPAAGVPYAVLIIVAWKLGVAYWIYFLQQSSHALYEYFHPEAGRQGPLASLGMGLVFVGALLKSSVVKAVDSPFWSIMVS